MAGRYLLLLALVVSRSDAAKRNDQARQFFRDTFEVPTENVARQVEPVPRQVEPLPHPRPSPAFSAHDKRKNMRQRSFPPHDNMIMRPDTPSPNKNNLAMRNDVQDMHKWWCANEANADSAVCANGRRVRGGPGDLASQMGEGNAHHKHHKDHRHPRQRSPAGGVSDQMEHPQRWQQKELRSPSQEEISKMHDGWCSREYNHNKLPCRLHSFVSFSFQTVCFVTHLSILYYRDLIILDGRKRCRSSGVKRIQKATLAGFWSGRKQVVQHAPATEEARRTWKLLKGWRNHLVLPVRSLCK